MYLSQDQIGLLRDLLENLESKVRRVRDVAYWGMPYGTPITPGMKPAGPTSPAGRARRMFSGDPVSKPTVNIRKPVSGEESEPYETNYDGMTPDEIHVQVRKYSGEQMNSHGPDQSIVGFVRIDALLDMPGNRTDPENVDSLKDSIRREGFREPVQVVFSPKSRKMYVGEGNHRLEVAKQLGIPWIPVRVTVERFEWNEDSIEYLEKNGARPKDAPKGWEDSPWKGMVGETYWPPDMHPYYLFDNEDVYDEYAVSGGDIIENDGQYQARLLDYATDRGLIPKRYGPENASLLKAHLAERLEEILRDAPTEDLLAVFEDDLADSNVAQQAILRFALTGNPESLNLAIEPDGIYYAFMTKEGVVDIDEFKYIEGNQDLLGREPVPVGTKDAEILVRQHVVSNFIKSWAATSNDRSVLSLAIQEAAREEFGLEGVADWKQVNVFVGNNEIVQDAPKTFYEKYGLTLRKFVRAQYAETQRVFKETNIKGVTVYRGMGVSTDDPILREASSLGPVPIGVVGRPLSSWSADYSTAKQFADDNAEPGISNGIVFKTTVAAEQVLSTPLSGFGCLEEEELVILGGTRDAEMLLSMYAANNTWGEE